MKCKTLVILLGVLIGVFPNFALGSDDSPDAVEDVQPATRVVVIPLDLGGKKRIDCSDCDGYFAPEPHDHHDWYFTKPELGTSGGGGQVHWDNLTNRPSGLDDGDDNTTYSADGLGVELSGSTFSLELDGATLTKSGAGLKVTDSTFAPVSHIHSGEQITSGTVADARIAGSIARDSEIVPTVLANDGTGSTLDADLLDGLEANAFWNISGNAGVITGTHFLGTTDNKALDFRVNNASALRLEPHATSPNVIGGHSDNSVSEGVYGATISGGGASGLGNVVSASYGTVGGGNRNMASGDRSTVGGGYYNTASGFATVGGGYYNRAIADRATVGGGYYNTASSDYATVPGGQRAVASHYGEMAYASGKFTSNGDAQTSLYVLRNLTESAEPTELFLDGSSQRLTIASGRVMTFDILVVAMEGGPNAYAAGYQIKGVVKSDFFGYLSFVGTPSKTVLGEEITSWDASVIADQTNGALVIQVIGWDAQPPIRWVASVRTVEAEYGW